MHTTLRSCESKPVTRDKLGICSKAGSTVSMQTFNKLVGIESKSQVLEGMFIIICFSASTDNE